MTRLRLAPWVMVLLALNLISCSATTVSLVPNPTPTTTTVPPSPNPSSTSTTVPPTATPPSTAAAATFTDPFAYCAAVGTIDAPDARYTGPKVPDSIARGLRKATNASPDAPLDFFVRGSFWRCLGGKVVACTVGANIPCEGKADLSRTPNSGMTDWCTSNPNTDFIPAAAAGRETVYEWRCTNGAPEIVKQALTPDARGFISEYWYVIGPS